MKVGSRYCIIFTFLLIMGYFNHDSIAQTTILNSSYLLYRPAVSDMRAKGMGNTEILSNSPVNAVLSNPALLPEQGRFGLSVGMRSISGENEAELVRKNEFGMNNLSHEGYLSDANHISHISAGFSVQDKESPLNTGFGIGYQKLYSADCIFDDYLQLIGSDYRFYSLKTYYNQDDVSEFLITTVAIKWKNISFGISSYKSIGISGLHSDYDWTWYYRDGIADTTMSETGQNYGYSPVKGDFATLGLVYQQNKIKLGLMFRSLYNHGNGGYVSVHPTNDDSWAEGQALKYYDYFPSILGIGFEYKPIENLILVGEFQNRLFSINRVHWKSFKDGDVKRFGAEYEVVEDVYFRLGFFLENIFVFSYDSNEPEMMNGFTFGLGIKKGILSVDLAVEYARFDYKIEGNLPFNDRKYYLRNENKILNAGTTISIHF